MPMLRRRRRKSVRSLPRPPSRRCSKSSGHSCGSAALRSSPSSASPPASRPSTSSLRAGFRAVGSARSPVPPRRDARPSPWPCSPAPPPVAEASGTGGTGIAASSEGFVHIHRNVLGDTDPTGGVSDIDSTVHRWLNPVVRVVLTVSVHVAAAGVIQIKCRVACAVGITAALHNRIETHRVIRRFGVSRGTGDCSSGGRPHSGRPALREMRIAIQGHSTAFQPMAS